LSTRENASLKSGGIFDIDAMKTEVASLEKKASEPAFWDDHTEAQKILKSISRLKEKIDLWDTLETRVNEQSDFLGMVLDEWSADLFIETLKGIDSLQKDLKLAEVANLLSDEDDSKNAIIAVQAGAGGTEACDWVSMLLRMYMAWAEKRGFGVNFIEETPGEVAGIKSVTFVVKGDYAYGYIKSERGVHRLVRLSPFDANKRRHTSFAAVEVFPEISDDIKVDINESDLKIDTYRASSAGGQHVNKTDSAVRITHLPTGIVVQCQNERSQHKNKEVAMKILMSRLYELGKIEQESKKEEVRKDHKDIAFGSQIRSYVFQPYQLVKDLRTGYEIGNVQAVMDGEIDDFIESFLKWRLSNEPRRVMEVDNGNE
jgi:peptide chain release factor 2